MMRFFIAILFIILYSATPLQTSAKVVFSNKMSSSFVTKAPAKQTLYDSFANSAQQFLPPAIQRTNIVHFSDNGFDRDLFHQQQMRLDTIIVKNHFLVAPFFYCKLFGLVLIFPEHFFF